MGDWFELRSRKDELTKIVSLLVEFDEKTGRHARYDCRWSHYLRKALSVAEPDELRLFLKKQGEFVYSIVGQVSGDSGFATTAWVHEDGIAQERGDQPADHPVHSIVCVSDLFAGAQAIESTEISPEALRLMEDNFPGRRRK